MRPTKFKIGLIVFCFHSIIFLGLFSPNIACPENTRDDVISSQLDCLSTNAVLRTNVNWREVCDTYYGRKAESSRDRDALIQKALNMEESGSKEDSNTMDDKTSEEQSDKDSFAEDILKEDLDEYHDPEYAPEQKKPSKIKDVFAGILNIKDNLVNIKSPLVDLTIAGEFELYRTSKPDDRQSRGYLFGLKSSYTQRIFENKKLASVSDFFKYGNKINMYRFDIRYAQGIQDYDSEPTIETATGSKLKIFEMRGLIGYDIPFENESILTPYFGFGYRTLRDSIVDIPNDYTFELYPTYVPGEIRMRRQIEYYYMPFGVETHSKINDDWMIDFNMEYDLFLDGQETHHYDDAGPNGIYSCLNGNCAWHQLNPIQFDLDSGFGLKGSCKILKQKSSYDMFLEPYVYYWQTNVSKPEIWSSGCCTTFYYGSNGQQITSQTPVTNSLEFGFNVGVNF